jgi:hypothetical protein
MMRKQVELASALIALPVPALAADADVMMIVSPIGIGMMIVAAVIGFGIGRFTKRTTR